MDAGDRDAAGGFDAVDSFAQLEVHQDDVRGQPGGQGDGLLAAARLADDLDVRFAAQEGEQSGAYDGVVVAEQDPYGGRGHEGSSGEGAGVGSGTSAETTVPRPVPIRS